LLALALVAVSLLSAEGPARAAACGGVTMPPSVSADGITLHLNGLGLREATLLHLDVYVAGLYLPAAERDARRILASDAPRQVRLQLLRDVSAADMAANVEAGFRRAAGAAFPRNAETLQRLVGLIPPLAKGDRFALTYLPGSGVRVEHGASLLGTLPGAEFARILFAIWLGEPPVSAPLKAGLLGAPCGG
jgi:long-chain acyl-CoA synthetase